MQLPASRQRLVEAILSDLRSGRARCVIVYGAIGAGLGYLGEAISAALDADRAEPTEASRAEEPVVLVADSTSLGSSEATSIARRVLAGSTRVVLLLSIHEPLAPDLAPLAESTWTRTFTVPPLTFDEIWEVATVLLDGEVAHGVVSLLFEATHGHERILVDAVSDAVDNAEIVRLDDLWVPSSAKITPGPRVSNLARTLLSGLDSETRNVVEATSLCGGLPTTALLDVYPLAAVENAEREGWLLLADGVLEVSPRLFAAAIATAVPSSRAITIAVDVLPALESVPKLPDRVRLRAAILALEVQGNLDLGTFTHVCASASRMHDYADLHTIASAAIGTELDLPARAHLAHALRFLGRPEAAVIALEPFERSEELIAATMDEERAGLARYCRVALHMRAEIALFGLDDVPAARRDMARADAIVPAAARNEPAATQSVLLEGYLDGSPRLRAHLDELRREPDRHSMDVERLAVPLITSSAIGGFTEDALTIAADAWERLRYATVSLPWSRVEIARARFFAQLRHGDHPLEVRESWLKADIVTATFDQAVSQMGSGLLAFALGDLPTAMRDLKAAVTNLRERDPMGYLAYASAAAAEACTVGGDVDGAIAQLALTRATPLRMSRILDLDRRLALTWAVRVESGVSGVEESAHELIEDARTVDAPGIELRAAHLLLRAGSDIDGLELASPAQRCQGPYHGAIAEHCLAWQARDGDGLVSAAAQFWKIGSRIHAAEAAVQAWSVLRSDGRVSGARSAKRQAIAYARSLSGVSTPLLTGWFVEIPLTARENEVATLAAQGLGNREVATRLKLSIRTVETHLQRAYSKLGVSDRTSLGDL